MVDISGIFQTTFIADILTVPVKDFCEASGIVQLED